MFKKAAKHNLDIPIVGNWIILGTKGFHIRIQQPKKYKYSLENFMDLSEKNDFKIMNSQIFS